VGSAPATTADPAPVPSNRRYVERFIHHPTQRWVDLCLPPNLRRTAYELPSDCADIAVILRHVWLAAHRRTERLGRFVVGSAAGDAEVAQTRAAIVGIGSINAASILNPYVDDAGRPLRSFATLQSRLHPGDVLVWAHHAHADPAGPRTSGHVHTIADIARVNGAVTQINVLQGNEPLPSSNQEFVTQVGEQARADRVPAPSGHEIHHAPGRRIEADTLTGTELGDVSVPRPARGGAPATTEPIWHWRSGTTLVAAGPPSGVRRPAAPAPRRGQPAQPRLLGWATALGGASIERLPIVLGGALSDARADIEGGIGVTDATATQLGVVAGRRLWALARRAGGLGHTKHFQPLQQILGLIDAYGGIRRSVPRNNPNAALVVARFTTLRDAFERAARGLDDVAFPATRGGRTVRVLVTGFDPFVFAGAPGPETWNPSGAAALALDGKVIRVGGLTVAIQAAVLPVDFDAFRTGIVERLVRDAGAVDGVVTVSMDASIASRDQVRLEQFVIGTHHLESGRREAIPAAPGSQSAGAVLEATDAPAVAGRMGSARTSAGPQPRALVGTDTTLQFGSIAEADAALTALGASPQGTAQPVITDPAVLRRLSSAARLSSGSGGGVTFSAGSPPRTFAFTLIAGPGGSFLSNEVSYRVLRERGSGAASFHVHVPGGPDVPLRPRTQAERRVRSEATGVRTAVIANVRRAVIELARLAASRRP
jgi:pyrrolidone-carboxylate peptidase